MPGIVYFILQCGQSLEASVQITIRPVARFRSRPTAQRKSGGERSSLTVGEASP